MLSTSREERRSVLRRGTDISESPVGTAADWSGETSGREGFPEERRGPASATVRSLHAFPVQLRSDLLDVIRSRGTDWISPIPERRVS
jgi:hypothetical protein